MPCEFSRPRSVCFTRAASVAVGRHNVARGLRDGFRNLARRHVLRSGARAQQAQQTCQGASPHKVSAVSIAIARPRIHCTRQAVLIHAQASTQAPRCWEGSRRSREEGRACARARARADVEHAHGALRRLHLRHGARHRRRVRRLGRQPVTVTCEPGATSKLGCPLPAACCHPSPAPAAPSPNTFAIPVRRNIALVVIHHGKLER